MFQVQTRLEELQSIHWDLYKDAYGFRPRHVDTSSWSEQDFAVEFEFLQTVVDREYQERQVAEAAAVARFETTVAGLVAIGAGTREDAIRWMHEAERTNGDADFLCYCLGLPYGYLK